MLIPSATVFQCVRMSLVSSVFKKFESPKRSLSTTLNKMNCPKIEESFITIDKRKIKYLRTGCGPHALLCCPGALGTAWMHFKHQILGLDHDKLTVVVWDPPGYGQSRPPEKDLKPGFFVRDAHLAYGLMKELKLPNFSVLGWSAGALPAIGLASTYQKNINKLVMWGACTTITDHEVQALAKLRDTDSWPDVMKSPYIALYGNDEFRSMFMAWMDTLISYNRQQDGDLSLSALKNVTCPVLTLHGNEDHLITLDQANSVSRILPGSEFYCFPKGRHNIHQQYPEEFNAVVTDFLLKSHA